MSVLDSEPAERWLARFEKAAVQIPEPRRSALRNEILADFEQAQFPEDLEAYPLPEQIVAEEIAAAGEIDVEARPRVRQRTLATGAIAIIVIATLLVVVLPVVLLVLRVLG
jgi:hypothetical protein